MAGEMEGMKNFPAFTNPNDGRGLLWFPGEGGPFQDSLDFMAGAPIPQYIPDGYIFSGGRTDQRRIVNDPTLNWPREKVLANQYVTMRWRVTAPHRYRGFRYFITRPDWLVGRNPNEGPRRADFEAAPFASIFNSENPFWVFPLESMSAPNRVPATSPDPEPGEYDAMHTIRIPGGRRGHHIILGIMMVADAGNGFYSALDVDFG